MYVVVAGGGHMGTHLIARLVAEGHDTVAIDTNPEVTQRIFAEQGVVAVTGSATDVGILDQAGVRRADAAIAMTGRDSDNLSFCLLARYYGVPRVLARMLNPQYAIPYRLVGATKVHSEADILVNSFLMSLEYPEISSPMSVGKGNLGAFAVRTAVGEAELGPAEQEALSVLQGVGFLSGAAREDLVGLAAGARFESRKRDEVLYTAGAPGGRLYVLRKGSVSLERGGDSVVLRPPAWLGEGGAVTGGPRRFTARVVEDAELLTLDGAVLRTMLLRTPFLALELSKPLSERATD